MAEPRHLITPDSIREDVRRRQRAHTLFDSGADSYPAKVFQASVARLLDACDELPDTWPNADIKNVKRRAAIVRGLLEP